MKRYACGVPESAIFLECDGVRIAVSREGKGMPLVCLHAVGHGGGDFDAVTAALRDQVEVIRIDWPGQGRSGPDRVPASAERYAQLLSQILESLEVSNPVIIGNSIGGAAALLYASRQPVRALVLCDSGGLVPVSALVRGMTRLFYRFFRAGERGAGWFARAYAWYYRFLVLPSPAAAAQRDRIIAAGPECAAVLAQAWQSFGEAGADLRGVAAAIQVPVWVAWSRSDRVIPLWMCRPAIRKIPDLRLTTFKGGHAAFLEQPEPFLQALLPLLGEWSELQGNAALAG